jgi:hypothetical protein
LHECSCHLSIWRQHLAESTSAPPLTNGGRAALLAKIRAHAVGAVRERHGPMLVHGGLGSGKSRLLSEVARDAVGWLEGRSVARVIRFSGATPRSAYGLELLRNVCQHLSLILGEYLRKHMYVHTYSSGCRVAAVLSLNLGLMRFGWCNTQTSTRSLAAPTSD